MRGPCGTKWARKGFGGACAILFVAVPSLCLASTAGGEGGGKAVFDLVMRTVNFLILVGVLVHFARKPVAKAIRGSIESVRKALKDAEKSRVRAEARMKEAEERLARMDQEVTQLLEGARKEGEVERERILAQAEEAVEKISREMVFATEQELKKSKETLKVYAADAAVALAGQILRKKVTPQDHRRFISDYLEKLETKH